VFLGDSITMCWTYPPDHQYPGGLESWNKYYKDSVSNFGITGDRTQNVLWRLTKGDCLKDYIGKNPRLLVLLIGVNNLLGGQEPPEEVAVGIKTTLAWLREKMPQTKILLLGVLPSGKDPQNPVRAKIAKVNELIAPLADEKTVFFRDFGKALSNPDGSIEQSIFRDFLHFSPAGYEAFAQVLNPVLRELSQLPLGQPEEKPQPEKK